jgi:hypothetical protein
MAGKDGVIMGLLQASRGGNVEAENEFFGGDTGCPGARSLFHAATAGRAFSALKRSARSDLSQAGGQEPRLPELASLFALAPRGMRRLLIEYIRNWVKRGLCHLPRSKRALAVDVSQADLALTMDRPALEKAQPELSSDRRVKVLYGA